MQKRSSENTKASKLCGWNFDRSGLDWGNLQHSPKSPSWWSGGEGITAPPQYLTPACPWAESGVWYWGPFEPRIWGPPTYCWTSAPPSLATPLDDRLRSATFEQHHCVDCSGLESTFVALYAALNLRTVKLHCLVQLLATYYIVALLLLP